LVRCYQKTSIAIVQLTTDNGPRTKIEIAMPTIKATVSCPIQDSFRVQQVAGMFDLPIGGLAATERFEVDVPGAGENWQIGLIVGPSGSGKSTVACRAFGNRIYAGAPWPSRRAVVDSFDHLSIRHVVELFTAVGFSSPPSWLKPYEVLSGGERFRCDLARALAGARSEERGARNQNSILDPRSSSLVVFDEFTSVVDRTVAKVCSAAVGRGIRRGAIPCRFVAVTCHYDVADWLEPDWVVDMATCELHRRRPRSLEVSAGRTEVSGVGCQVSGRNDIGHHAPDMRFRRPAIRLEIHRCEMAAWRLFRRHHYLSGELPYGSRCFLTTWEGVPVNFCATAAVIARRNHRRFARIVTLPDFQGIGIGMRVVGAIAELHRAEGHRISVTSSHPALVRHCERSPLWRLVGIRRGDRRRSRVSPKYRPTGRTVVSFEYCGKGEGGRGSAEGGVGKDESDTGHVTPKRGI
jgi:GNAT superfamily N-acetyltransferase